MEERLITFETARLAKEKGFDWKTRFRYQGDKDYIVGGSLYNHNDVEEQSLWNIMLYSAPTQSLLQKWLREKHKLIVSVIPFKDHSADVNDDYVFQYRIHYKGVYGSNKSYEEALEEGLQEALKLIK